MDWEVYHRDTPGPCSRCLFKKIIINTSLTHTLSRDYQTRYNYWEWENSTFKLIKYWWEVNPPRYFFPCSPYSLQVLESDFLWISTSHNRVDKESFGQENSWKRKGDVSLPQWINKDRRKERCYKRPREHTRIRVRREHNTSIFHFPTNSYTNLIFPCIFQL